MRKMAATSRQLTPVRCATFAIVVGATLAVSGWVFAQERSAAPPPTAARASGPPSRPDPVGPAAGAIGAISTKDAGEPSPGAITDHVGRNDVPVNAMWTLLAGFLVMVMQSGFALVERRS